MKYNSSRIIDKTIETAKNNKGSVSEVFMPIYTEDSPYKVTYALAKISYDNFHMENSLNYTIGLKVPGTLSNSHSDSTIGPRDVSDLEFVVVKDQATVPRELLNAQSKRTDALKKRSEPSLGFKLLKAFLSSDLSHLLFGWSIVLLWVVVFFP